MDEAKRQGGRALRMLMALLLAALLIPVATPGAARADEGSSAGGDEANLAALLSAGDYVEGEVLVAVDNAAVQNGPRTRGMNILANAESLMDVSGETYATATGENLPLEEPPANGPALLRSASALPAENAVSVMLVRQEGASTEDLLRQLQGDPRVLFAEPNYTYTPGDPTREASEAQTAAIASALGLDPQAIVGSEGVGRTTAPTADGANTKDLSMYQWGCENTGETMVEEDPRFAPLTGFDINPPSWDTPGATNASGVVAVVDSGIDYNHPDLKDAMDIDMTQYSKRGGEHGFNALAGADPKDPMDDHSHGTHCAGIIAATWNDTGVSGVASGVKLVAVKAGNENNQLSQSSIIAGYEYLAETMDNGLDLRAINNSWGGQGMSKAFSLAATKLGEKGAVSIVASGNESTDLDKNPGTPSTLVGNPYTVVVDASTSAGTLASFSNYGVETTDVVAPGQAILSTVPRDKSSYLPEADKEPLSFVTFENENPTVNVYQFKPDDDPIGTSIGAVVKDASRYDMDGGALKVSIADMTEGPNSGPFGSFKEAVVTIPVDADKQGETTYAGMHLLTSPRGNDVAYVQFRIKNPDGTLDWTQLAQSALATMTDCSRGWVNLIANAQSLAVQSGGELVFPNGELQVKLTLGRQGKQFEPDDALYLDAVGVGKEGSAAPYLMMSGTSMATPMVTGAAMVLAEQVSGKTAAERAAALAARVKASVRPVSAFSGLCTSGGHVDLDLTPDQFTPVVSSAQVDSSTSPAHIIIGGSYFGNDEGTVTVAGKSAPVISWSDTSLTVECPTGVKSGVLVIEVTSQNGQSGKRGFLLELPKTPGSESTPLFEKTIPLPTPEEGLDEGFMGSALTGLGGSLYMLPMDASHTEGSFWQLWCYDPTGGSWTHTELPEALSDFTSMAAYGGKMYLYGEKGAGAATTAHLMRYDPQTDFWQILPATNLPLHASITNCDGQLLLVGGATFVPGTPPTVPDRWVDKTKDNIVALDPETGEATAVGTLLHAVSSPTVVIRGTEMYVARGYTFNATGAIQSSTNLERLTKTGNGYTSEDMTNMLPEHAPDRAPHFDTAAVKDGIVLVGFVGTTGEDEDTYLLDIAHGATAFTGFGKRVSRAPLYYTLTTAYDGWLYTLGLSSYEPGGKVLRATRVETMPSAGDVTPGPGPDKHEPSTVARTGDTLGVATATLACAAIGALACAAVALRRKMRTSTNPHR